MLLELAASLLLSPALASHRVETNAAVFESAPDWLKEARAERVISRIQSSLEWDIRRIRVHWYTDETAFQATHGFDGSVQAVARKADMTIHVGPRVDAANFDEVFGHELAHIILYQKYRDAIPKWLEEGLANHVARKGKVDYAWLGRQPPVDVRGLAHPFRAADTAASSREAGVSTSRGPKYHYQLSTAAIELIASRCDLHELIQLSVGKSLEKYLGTFCGIDDVNAALGAWIQRKSRSVKSSKP